MMHRRFIHAPADTLREHRLIFDMENGGGQERVEQTAKTEGANNAPNIQNPNTDVQAHANDRMGAMGKQFNDFMEQLKTAYAEVDPKFKADMEAEQKQKDEAAAPASRRNATRRGARRQAEEKESKESANEVPATLDQKARVAAGKIGIELHQLENAEPARKQELVRRVMGNATITATPDGNRLMVRYNGAPRPEFTEDRAEELRADLHFWREDDVEELDQQDALDFVKEDLGLPVKNMDQALKLFGQNTHFVTDVHGEVIIADLDPAIYRSVGNQRPYITQTQLEDSGSGTKGILRRRLRAALRS